MAACRKANLPGMTCADATVMSGARDKPTEID